MTAAIELGPYRVVAVNTAHASDNKIHDEATARRFGFGGALVPGVDVYGYMTHLPVARWGRAWLDHGTAECRFYKPVHDGDTVTVTAREADGGLDLTAESRGVICATGHMALPDPAPMPDLAAFPRTLQRNQRPPADEASLMPDAWLGLDPYPITGEQAATSLADLRESAPIYREQGLLHPRDILRSCNLVLRQNVVLGPWIHTGSRIRHLAAAAVGCTLSVRARITGNYQHKGHAFVELDALVLADENVPVARIAHIAIYRPRQVAAA